MNERLKELAVQAGLPKYMTRELCPTVLEKFAELVREDERTSNSKTIDVTDIVLRAKAEEREACALLCDDWFASTAGQAIRERGEK
jgi:hypothetical protein